MMVANTVALVACSAQKSMTREQYESGIEAWMERVRDDPRGQLSEEPPIPTAETLYSASDLFRKASSWAKHYADRWLILSARHGLIEPDLPTVPYNATLNMMSASERRAWGRGVLHSLTAYTAPGPHPGAATIKRGATVIILAGRKYRDPIVGPLRRLGFAVECPLEGLGIGQQKAWLKRNNAARQRSLPL